MEDTPQNFRRSNKDRNPQKRHRFFVVALAVILFFVSTLATVGIYSYFNPESNLFSWLKSKTPGNNEKLPLLNERFNLLVLGVDEREDDLGRSDTILFFSLSSEDELPILISIPRDTMIYNDDLQDFDRINNVFPLNGIRDSVKAVENLLGLPVHGYVKLNIEGFVELVDIMGGVKLDVEEQMDYEDPDQDLYIHILPGYQLLDGKTAMEYVRFRSDGDGDIGRIARQQKFLQAALEQALSLTNIGRIPGMIKQGLSMVETDLNLNSMLTLSNTIIKGAKKSFYSYTLPGEGLFYDDASLYMLYLDEMYEELAELIVPDDQKETYLNLLKEPWVEEYKEVYIESLEWALAVWEETGLWLNQSEYQNWLEGPSIEDDEEESDEDFEEENSEELPEEFEPVDPEGEEPEDPDEEEPENPDAREPENPDDGEPENPDDGEPENPDDGEEEEPIIP